MNSFRLSESQTIEDFGAALHLMRADLEHLRSVFMAVENGDLGTLKSLGIKDSELGDVKFFLEKLVKTGFLDWTGTFATNPPPMSRMTNYWLVLQDTVIALSSHQPIRLKTLNFLFCRYLLSFSLLYHPVLTIENIVLAVFCRLSCPNLLLLLLQRMPWAPRYIETQNET